MRISFDETIQLLKKGEVVAVPTETVYGLAASLEHLAAIEKIFLLKGRPKANPLIIHIASAQLLKHYVTEFPPGFEELARAFWPGPLTCILPIDPSKIPTIVRAGLLTAGFRIPSFGLTLDLLKQTGPLVMPSANLSGRPSATCPEHIEEDFGKEFPLLEGGNCQRGVESTILLYRESEWVIVRLGALSAVDFFPILGYAPSFQQKRDDLQPLCPGQAFRHYAPKARLFLGNSHEMEKSECVLGFRERIYPNNKRVFLLGSIDDPKEVAYHLYDVLRQLDVEEVENAWIDMNFPKEGLWLTIYERLHRASQ